MKSSQLYFELINHFQHSVLTQKEHFESYLSLVNSPQSQQGQVISQSQLSNSSSFEAINVSIICYGLGNFSKTHASMSQLALLVGLRDFINAYEINQEMQQNQKKQNKNQKQNQNNGNASIIDEDGKEDSKDNNDSNDNNNNNGNGGKGKHVFSWEKNAIDKEKFDEKRKLFEQFPFRLKSVEFYEPILTPLETQILENLLDIKVLNENTDGLYGLSDKPNEYNDILLCYMPHCPKLLYNNMLYSNWSQSQLSKLFVVGNSFAVK